ncbi:hypothetical protein QJS04_geneDACA000290 [Acorus gramineus]|uniref:Uncharacterized protein n=1 Tax=Acorus gramineus TaxID=55184 RepID=A0AAV9ATR7_ACOGR|nr:hypothetical protein QJS04_geneDACA000290 [Acorus gramineus]
MFQDDEPYNINEFSNFCQKEFGVTPRPHWISMDFGGHKIKSVLKFLQKFSSNVIFTNGLRDPYNSGGVLENISDSVVAIRTQLWFSLLRY